VAVVSLLRLMQCGALGVPAHVRNLMGRGRFWQQCTT
jgi:hypothetical protein